MSEAGFYPRRIIDGISFYIGKFTYLYKTA
jgi:hypothetical protein